MGQASLSLKAAAPSVAAPSVAVSQATPISDKEAQDIFETDSDSEEEEDTAPVSYR